MNGSAVAARGGSPMSVELAQVADRLRRLAEQVKDPQQVAGALGELQALANTADRIAHELRLMEPVVRAAEDYVEQAGGPGRREAFGRLLGAVERWKG